MVGLHAQIYRENLLGDKTEKWTYISGGFKVVKVTPKNNNNYNKNIFCNYGTVIIIIIEIVIGKLIILSK